VSRKLVVGNEHGEVEVDLEASEWPHVGDFSLKVRLLRARGFRRREPRVPSLGLVPVDLVEPVTFELRLDTSGVLALAVKAARAKGRKAKQGVVTIQGGMPRPRWVTDLSNVLDAKEGQNHGEGGTQ
jgi:hypothetical protein